MKILAYSKALYSSWLYYSPDRILFDAGESVSSIMGNKSFAVENVFLSHGHTDHIAGLVSLVNIRNNAMGDKKKPLTVYYPRNNFHISELINYITRTNSNVKYPLEWVPLEAGEEIQVYGKDGSRNPRFVTAFSTEHSRSEVSLGYNVIEERQRLKDEYSDLSQEEIRELAERKGRDGLMETYRQKIFTYGGDSVPLDPKKIEGTEVLCHDCTFLVEEDRKMYKHATLEEAIKVGKEAGVKKKFIGFHISSRYKDKIQGLREEVIDSEDPPFETELVSPGRIYRDD
ncbi:MBL fold metallo-hydrolase [Candidatus Bipolaricaulota bacterium]|nr:MBL fold metallo-hydrolase [Candidatus Bipolaricaulota bacterium]